MHQRAQTSRSGKELSIDQVEGQAAAVHVEPGEDLGDARVSVEDDLHRRRHRAGQDGHRGIRSCYQHRLAIPALRRMRPLAADSSTRFVDRPKFLLGLLGIRDQENADVK